MEKESKHISELELIGFNKGSLTDQVQLEGILSHLMSCEECREHLRDIRDFTDHFDQIFDTLFPDPMSEVTQWITKAGLSAEKKAGEALERVHQKIVDGRFELADRLIPNIKLAADAEAEEEAGEKKDVSHVVLLAEGGLLDPGKATIHLIDNNLSVVFRDNPGYTKAMVIGVGTDFAAYADLMEITDEFSYHFTLTGLTDSFLLVLY